MTDAIKFHIGDPWFDFIIDGRKKVEGKVAKGKALLIKPGCILHISGDRGLVIECHVMAVRSYGSFIEYLEGEGLPATLPGIHSIEAGLAVYAQYYPLGLDKDLGVLAIELKFVRIVS